MVLADIYEVASMTELKGRTVMVTGAGKNIGKEIALAFAQKGANVVVCDLNEENTLARITMAAPASRRAS